MDMRIMLDTTDYLLTETMLHAAITGLERDDDESTLVMVDPWNGKNVAEGKYMRYGQDGNSEPLWTVTDLNRGTGVNCFTIAETIAAFVDITD